VFIARTRSIALIELFRNKHRQHTSVQFFLRYFVAFGRLLESLMCFRVSCPFPVAVLIRGSGLLATSDHRLLRNIGRTHNAHCLRLQRHSRALPYRRHHRVAGEAAVPSPLRLDDWWGRLAQAPPQILGSRHRDDRNHTLSVIPHEALSDRVPSRNNSASLDRSRQASKAGAPPDFPAKGSPGASHRGRPDPGRLPDADRSRFDRVRYNPPD
jgi:hypothetical protein